MKIVLDWQISSFFGWGIFGLNMALEWAKRGDIEAMSSWAPASDDDIVLDPLRAHAIAPFVARTNEYPLRKDLDDLIHIHPLGNQGLPEHPNPRIGFTFFEEQPSLEAIERLKRYDIILTGSTWNTDLLKSCGVSNVRTVFQGVDRSIFCPGPKSNLFPGRFLIFSGGKAEPRKGQDIVVKAFRIFAKKHPEAMLVTAWNSPWPEFAAGMDLDLSEFPDRVISIGQVPNFMMAPVYRECDVGLFPNRREGGTNLVAMEAIACGMPVIVSECTGQKDLRDMGNDDTAFVAVRDGEPDLDAILHALDHAFITRRHLGSSGHRLPDWSETAAGIEAAVREIFP